eukprot:Platyproteum_vivax@DN7290_c0_g1_i3.p1
MLVRKLAIWTILFSLVALLILPVGGLEVQNRLSNRRFGRHLSSPDQKEQLGSKRPLSQNEADQWGSYPSGEEGSEGPTAKKGRIDEEADYSNDSFELLVIDEGDIASDADQWGDHPNLEEGSAASSRSASPLSSEKDVWPCPKCSKAFESDAYLNDHMQTYHSKEALLLNADFINEEPLDLTMPKLTEESSPHGTQKNVWPCPKCSKAFASDAYLNDHMQTYHSKEKPEANLRPQKTSDFVCPHCNQPFVSEKRLWDHERSFHSYLQPLPSSVTP